MRRLSTTRFLPRTHNLPAWLWAGVVAMNLMLFAYTAVSLDRSRRLAQAQAAEWTGNLALALERELAGNVAAIDLMLRSVIDEIDRQRRAGGVERTQLNDYIARVRARVPFVDGVRITDADGILRYGTDVDPQRAVDVSDRPHFIELRTLQSDALAVSGLQRSHANGKWAIVFARRVVGTDGRFDGMAFVPVAIEDLTRTFARIAIPDGGSVTLRGADLGLVVRYPAAPHGRPFPVGHSDVGAQLRGLVESGAAEGTVHAVAPIDGVMRVRSFRRVEGVPLYLVIGRSPDEYLAGWRGERLRGAIMLGAFMLVSGFTSWLLHRYWRRLEAALRTKDRMARTDFLTGLVNRRAFIAAVEREISRVRRYASTFSVLLIDVDHFKQVNDMWGHAVGDATLRGLARCARRSLRDVDLMGRWGGEEFAVLLPDTDAASATDAAERLRALVESAVLTEGEHPIRATVSVGVATLASDGESVDALMQRADRALYRAKGAGRNRVSD